MLPGSVVRGQKNPVSVALPERLQAARRSVGLSASALSLAAGVGRASVGRIERGQRLPRLPMLESLADALRVSPGWLAFGVQGEWMPAGGLRCVGFAARAAEARAARGLGVRVVARLAGIAPVEVRSLESGTVPSVETAENLARALAVNPAWLAFGTGQMDLPPRRGGRPRAAAASAP